MTEPKPYHVSGIQPTGQLHLGNYFGAVRHWIGAHVNGAYFIADYHALTSGTSPDDVRRNSLRLAKALMALGLFVDRGGHQALLYRQSDVPEVTELAWILSTLISTAHLERGHAFRTAKEGPENPNLGILAYPVLQAADILIHSRTDRTLFVPVGPDQEQHLEIARELARRFNHHFDPVFGEPEPLVYAAEVISGTDGVKMSKSRGNTIPLFPEAELKAAVGRVVTDSTPLEDPKDPDTCTVARLLRWLLSPDERAELEAQYKAGGFGYGTAKALLKEKLVEHLQDAWQWYGATQDAEIEHILLRDAEIVRSQAQEVMARVRQAVGLGPLRQIRWAESYKALIQNVARRSGRCVRCGAPYGTGGYCSNRFHPTKPCQGGRGEEARPYHYHSLIPIEPLPEGAKLIFDRAPEDEDEQVNDR